jgi:predicted DNA-binding protein with PD1-like motif
MKVKFGQNILFVVMEKRELFSQDLTSILSMREMKNTGIVQTALGMVKNIDLGYGVYFPFHFHAYLGDKNKKAVGGHLFDYVVVTFVEMSILLSNVRVKKVEKAGLLEMDFE